MTVVGNLQHAAVAVVALRAVVIDSAVAHTQCGGIVKADCGGTFSAGVIYIADLTMRKALHTVVACRAVRRTIHAWRTVSAVWPEPCVATRAFAARRVGT